MCRSNMNLLSSGFLKIVLSNEELSNKIHQKLLFEDSFRDYFYAETNKLALDQDSKNLFLPKRPIFAEILHQCPATDDYHACTPIRVSSYSGQPSSKRRQLFPNIFSGGAGGLRFCSSTRMKGMPWQPQSFKQTCKLTIFLTMNHCLFQRN